MTAALLILLGMVILVVGAEALVRGASRIAAAAGVSPLVVGLTVVAFGTSAPELAVSVDAALSGAGEVAIGNAIGSNIFNVLAILGVAALFGGLVVHQRIVRIDVPLLVLVTAAVWWLAADGRLTLVEGVALLVAIVAYTVFSYMIGRRESRSIEQEYAAAFGADRHAARRALPKTVALVAVGLAALVIGAQLLVDGAVSVAAVLGVSDLVVGLTVVAAGTSLPELATSVVAARRGERDIAVGNVVGSNLFNLLAVLGAAAVAGGGLDVPSAVIATDFPVTLLVTLVALPALAIGLYLGRWEGVVLLVAYAGYLAYTVVAATVPAPQARATLLAGLGVAALGLVVVGILAERRTARRSPP